MTLEVDPMLDQARMLVLLQQLSYYEGPADDRIAIRRGIRLFQQDAGLIVDGIFGPKTSNALAHIGDRLLNGNIARRYARFRLTRYYVENETDYSGAHTIPMLDEDHRVIAMVSAMFFVHVSLEGTGKLTDGRLVNVASKRLAVPAEDYADVLARARAELPTHPEWGGINIGPAGEVTHAQTFSVLADVGVGYGTVNGDPYVPFKTVAADLGAYAGCDARFQGKGGLVPRGTRLYIPEAAGKTFPDGKEHDGWFRVNDTGSAIQKAHLDVFCGTRMWAKTSWNLPLHGHVWFQILDADGRVLDTVETRIPFGYIGGLAD